MNNVERDFEEYRTALHEEALRYACFVRVYKRLHQRKEDRLDEMNIAPAFFQTVLSALFSVIVLWMEKLFSERSERGLFDFLRFIEKHLQDLSVEELKRRRGYPDGHWVLDRTRYARDA